MLEDAGPTERIISNQGRRLHDDDDSGQLEPNSANNV
jgi:hypothetical protein